MEIDSDPEFEYESKSESENDTDGDSYEEHGSDYESEVEEEEECQSSENDSEENESDENADEMDTEPYIIDDKKKASKIKPATKKTVSTKQDKKPKSDKNGEKKSMEKKMKEVDDFQTKIFTEEVQMANEISNRYASDTLTHYIPIDKNDQKKIFFNWICDSGIETKDVNFEEWQTNHSAREAYFLGPDNVIKYCFLRF